jgi:phage host-nuclease inhibitor protein Gam
MVSLDFHVFFSTKKGDDDDALIPTPDKVLQAMSSIDLSGYIQNFVWESKPFRDNIFYETMNVVFRTDESDMMEENTAPPTTMAPQVNNQFNKVVIHVALSYSFHDTTVTAMRAPGAAEITGLLNQTDMFFSQLVRDELPDNSGFSTLSFVAKSVDYRQENEFSVVVYAEVHVSFTPDSNAEHHATDEQILALMETADMGEYVEFYVWFSEPVGR